MFITYMSQVTYSNLTNSAKFVADYGELPCSELQHVRALSAECLCSVFSAAYPQSNWLAKLLILVANKTIISNLLIVIAERKSPNNSQDASYLNSRHFICRSFSAIPRTLCEVSANSSWGVCKLFMRCPWTHREVSVNASRNTVLSHVRIRRLPIWQFHRKTLLVSCTVLWQWCMLHVPCLYTVCTVYCKYSCMHKHTHTCTHTHLCTPLVTLWSC